MARAALKPKTSSRPGSPLKKPRGRPVGSKNKAKTTLAREPAVVSKPKRTTAMKAAPASAKLSKADLEVQVVKLERALALSRKKVAELKRMVTDANERADQATLDHPDAPLVLSGKKMAELRQMVSHAKAPADEAIVDKPAARVSKQKPVKQKLAATRGRRKKAETVEQDEPVLEEGTGEAETEAHAS